MAKDLNKVMLIGRLGKDPEMKYTPTGKATCRFTLATSDSYKPADGGDAPTTWHNVVAWEKLAELCSQYLKKGSRLYVEGRISNRSYEQDGQKKYISEVVMNNMIFLDNKGSGGGSSDSMPSEVNENGSGSSGDDDLPF